MANEGARKVPELWNEDDPLWRLLVLPELRNGGMLVIDERQHDVLARTIYGEARGESTVSQELVGWVIRNRVERGGWYGDTYSEVCLKPYQFSCWLRSDPNHDKLLAASGNAWETAQAVATVVMTASQTKNPIPGFLHYVDTSLANSLPDWAHKMERRRFDLAPKFIFLK